MWMPIFVSGNYPQGEFPPAVVQQIAEGYDPEGDIEAPCVVGHFDNLLAERVENELADGWVKSLFAQASDAGMQLMAELDLSSSLIEKIQQKKLRYVSVELGKEKDAQGNESIKLLRIAFLGRTLPAVNTAKVPTVFRWALKSFGLNFNEESTEKTLRFSRRIDMTQFSENPNEGGQESNQESNQGPHQESNPEEDNQEPNRQEEIEDMPEVTEEQFQAEQAKAARFQQEAEAARKEAEANKAELAKFQQEKEKAAVETRLSALRDAGKLQPAKFEQAVGLALQLEGDFREQYFQQLEAVEAKVHFGEQAPGSEAATQQEGELSLNEQVRKFAKEHDLSFEVAARKLAAAKPEVFANKS